MLADTGALLEPQDSLQAAEQHLVLLNTGCAGRDANSGVRPMRPPRERDGEKSRGSAGGRSRCHCAQTAQRRARSLAGLALTSKRCAAAHTTCPRRAAWLRIPALSFTPHHPHIIAIGLNRSDQIDRFCSICAETKRSGHLISVDIKGDSLDLN